MKIKRISMILSALLLMTACGADADVFPEQGTGAETAVISTPADETGAVDETVTEGSGETDVTETGTDETVDDTDTDVVTDETGDPETDPDTVTDEQDGEEEDPEGDGEEVIDLDGGSQGGEDDENRGCVGDDALAW